MENLRRSMTHRVSARPQSTGSTTVGKSWDFTWPVVETRMDSSGPSNRCIRTEQTTDNGKPARSCKSGPGINSSKDIERKRSHDLKSLMSASANSSLQDRKLACAIFRLTLGINTVIHHHIHSESSVPTEVKKGVAP